MNAECINPFIKGATSVMSQVLNKPMTLGKLRALPNSYTTQNVSVVFGITGDLYGQVIFGMDDATAKKITELMLSGMSCDDEALAASTLSELGNMISGNSMTNFSVVGKVCDISPPSIIRGSDVSISMQNLPTLLVTIAIQDIGDFEISLSVKAKETAAAA